MPQVAGAVPLSGVVNLDAPLGVCVPLSGVVYLGVLCRCCAPPLSGVGNLVWPLSGVVDLGLPPVVGF